MDRRQEEKIVAQRCRDAGQQRGPQPETDRDADHRGEKHQVDVFDAEYRLDQFCGAQRHRDDDQRHQIGAWIERFGPIRRSHGLFRDRFRCQLVARDYMHADIAGPPHQIVHHRAAHDFEPARAPRFSDHDLRDVVGMGKVDHVIGDAAIAGAIPKSAFAANAEAKVCAVAIAALLQGETPAPPKLINTCYSLVAPDYGISIAGVYHPAGGQLADVEGAGGISPIDAPAEFRALEAVYAEAWFRTITAETFG